MMLRPLIEIFLISTIACKHYLVEMEARDRQEESSKYLVETESKDRFEEGPDYPLGRSSRRGNKLTPSHHSPHHKDPSYCVQTSDLYS